MCKVSFSCFLNKKRLLSELNTLCRRQRRVISFHCHIMMLHWIQMYWWSWCINLCSDGCFCIKNGYSFTFRLQTCLPLNTERTWKTFMKYVLNHSANATALTIVTSVSSIFLSKQPWQLILILSLDHKTHACEKPLNHL